ncbi:sensor histidine kinase [Mucilaginibacter auburnensis]|uniref:histidine kinase n=1 Tax=Mucilaginibacter auburnensis TaxID=1457233 RepID=A0A2H9VQW2_9SPHI|nr:ATP-binding protein [Mucilaginibacter auburnensis]PJJ83158.1 signal transduction histidine kinase [Mucilaginibacter auburnensis]
MDDIKQIIILSTCIFLLAPLALIIYINAYNRRKKRHIEEQEHLKTAFKQELLKTQIEVQEQTLTDFSREIHDNITQVLSFVKLNLARVAKAVPDAEQKIEENRELIARAISDLRHLSKSLSFEHVMQQGLIKALEAETNRVNDSGLINIYLRIDGESYTLGEQRELILFRIFQETLNNALKYANAGKLNITLQYSEQLFNLTLEDDGVGFSPEELANNIGSGLKNMQNRAAMMGAVANIYSSPGNGCSINIALNPNTKQLYADGTPPNSIS